MNAEENLGGFYLTRARKDAGHPRAHSQQGEEMTQMVSTNELKAVQNFMNKRGQGRHADSRLAAKYLKMTDERLQQAVAQLAAANDRSVAYFNTGPEVPVGRAQTVSRHRTIGGMFVSQPTLTR